jgi:hypothetical protein
MVEAAAIFIFTYRCVILNISLQYASKVAPQDGLQSTIYLLPVLGVGQ